MKFLLTILIFLLPFLSLAQSSSNASLNGGCSDSVKNNEKAQTLIDDLLSTWNLGFIDEESPADIWLYNKFKDLFVEDATIDDQINAKYVLDPLDLNKGHYVVKQNIPYYEYAHNFLLEIKSLTVNPSDDMKPQIVWKNCNEGHFFITRDLTSTKRRPYVLDELKDSFMYKQIMFRQKDKKNPINLRYCDSLQRIYSRNKIYDDSDMVYTFNSKVKYQINIKLDEETKEYLISKIAIANVIQPLNCPFDSDSDAILTLPVENLPEDLDTSNAGDFTANGRPDLDYDGVYHYKNDILLNKDSCDKCPFIYGVDWNRGCPSKYFYNRLEFSAFLGLVMPSRALMLPEVMKAGYMDLDATMSSKGALAYEVPVINLTYNAGGDISYYFGKTKQFGISFGFNWTILNTNYEVDEPLVYTFKSVDNGGDYYRRRISILKGSTEEVKLNVWNLPLMLKYRNHFGKSERLRNHYWEIAAGPSITQINSKSVYEIKANYEGLYQVDTVSQDRLTYYNYFDPGSTWNVLLTGDGINHQGNNESVSAFFQALNNRGYDFAYQKIQRGEQKSVVRRTISWNMNVNYGYKVNEFVAIKIGLNALYAKTSKSMNDFQPMNKSSDTYPSLLMSNTDYNFFRAGLSVGVAVGIY